MAVRKFKPTTPGQRHKIIGTFEEITASVPEKSLVCGKRSHRRAQRTLRPDGNTGRRKRLPSLFVHERTAQTETTCLLYTSRCV